MARLDISTIAVAQTEQLLTFARQIAELSLYGSELEYDIGRGEDAMDTLNSLIEEARDLTGQEEREE